MMQKKKWKCLIKYLSDYMWPIVLNVLLLIKKNQTNRAPKNEEQRLQILLQKLHQTMNHFKTNTKQKHVALLSYNI